MCELCLWEGFFLIGKLLRSIVFVSSFLFDRSYFPKRIQHERPWVIRTIPSFRRVLSTGTCFLFKEERVPVTDKYSRWNGQSLWPRRTFMICRIELQLAFEKAIRHILKHSTALLKRRNWLGGWCLREKEFLWLTCRSWWPLFFSFSLF